ncbi:MAG: AAA family ATPase [Caldilineaceae bacterium]
MQKIAIRNFMALQDVDIEIKNLLILIGEQASGKSTISKLVYFFKSIRQDLIEVIYDDLDGDPALHTQLWRKIGSKFYNYFGSTKHLENFEITYWYDETNRLNLSLAEDKSLKVSFQPSEFYQSLFYGQMVTLIDEVKSHLKQENIYEQRAFQRSLNDLERYTETLFHDRQIPLYLPAGRNISVNYPEPFRFEFYGNLRGGIALQETKPNPVPSSDLYLMSSFLEQVERIKQRFRSNDFHTLLQDYQALGKSANEHVLRLVIDHIAKILRGDYQHDQNSEKIYYDAQHYVYLNNASSGQQEAIRILQDAFLTILDNEGVFRVIEEPEAHLYPTAQKYLMEILVMMLNYTDSQLIITTHSPYILGIVNNLLYATRVARNNPLASADVEQILPQATWLNPQDVTAYFLSDGGGESIIDSAMGLLDQNMLDEISEELGAEFQDLYRIHAREIA